MARFTAENETLATEIIGRYPVKKSACIPLCHLAQEQDGYLADDAMVHIAELLEITPAEVIGTASFYEMFKREPVGRYVVNVCTSIACFLRGGDELLHHAEQKLGIKAGTTTADGQFTVEGYECLAACTEAPCLQVNYRYFHKVTNDGFDRLVDDLKAGRLHDHIPPHGTLQRMRQHITADRAAGPASPTAGVEPVWLADRAALVGTAAGNGRDGGSGSSVAASSAPTAPAADPTAPAAMKAPAAKNAPAPRKAPAAMRPAAAKKTPPAAKKAPPVRKAPVAKKAAAPDTDTGSDTEAGPGTEIGPSTEVGTGPGTDTAAGTDTGNEDGND